MSRLESRGQRLGRRIAAVLVFVLAIGLFVDRLLVVRHGLGSAAWPTVAAEVISVEARPLGGGRAQVSWILRIRYHYQVEGQAYEGHRIRFTRSLEARSRQDVDRALERFQVGQAVTIHYHPKHPSVSVIEPGAGRSGWLGLVLAMLLLGVSVLFWMVPTRRVSARDQR